MYETLVHFLKTFSAENPLPWALLVMTVIAGAGLTLYAFWELLLRSLRPVFSAGRSSRATKGAAAATDAGMSGGAGRGSSGGGATAGTAPGADAAATGAATKTDAGSGER